jgi:hypothetical protein
MIRARLADNPVLANSNYPSQLDALPKPSRSAVRDGDWAASESDDPNQIIPTSYITAGMVGWTPDGWRKFNMTAMAFDPAGGGQDAAVLAYRHGPWYGPLVSEKGKQTGEATTGVNNIFSKRRDGCPVIIDNGGGYAGAIRESVKNANIGLDRCPPLCPSIRAAPINQTCHQRPGGTPKPALSAAGFDRS